MTSPDFARFYRTEHVKTAAAADTASIALRMALAMLIAERSRARTGEAQEHYDASQQRRGREDNRSRQEMQQSNQAARYARPPVLMAAALPEGGYGDGLVGVPLGLDQGMVRIASAIGAGFAEKIALAGTPVPAPKSPPGFLSRSFGKGRLAGTLAGTAAVVGAGALANKAAKKTSQFMSEEGPTPDWGNRRHGGPQLSYDVNEYGYAQKGTPFSAG